VPQSKIQDLDKGLKFSEVGLFSNKVYLKNVSLLIWRKAFNCMGLWLTKERNMKTFRTLDLAIEFHKSIEKLGLTGHMKDQLFRAATSIPLNLAEGNARYTSKDKKRFYLTAYSSLQECKTILGLFRRGMMKLKS
jgi:four helix bundle protein